MIDLRNPFQKRPEEKLWNEFNSQPRNDWEFKGLILDGITKPTHNPTVDQFFCDRVLQVILSPAKVNFPANLKREYSPPNWQEVENEALSPEDHQFEFQLITGYMKQLRDRNDKKSRDYKNFYQKMSKSIFPNLIQADQDAFVQEFQWRSYSEKEFVLNFFEPIEELRMKKDVPERTKLKATRSVHKFLESTKDSESPYYANKTNLFNVYAYHLTGQYEKSNLINNRSEDDTLVLETLDFIYDNLDSMGNLSLSGDIFMKALSYYEGHAKQIWFARGFLGALNGKSRVHGIDRKTGKKLLNMFAGDQAIEPAVVNEVKLTEDEEQKAAIEQEEKRHEDELAKREAEKDEALRRKIQTIVVAH